MSKKISVFGFGKWGKALIKVLCDAGNTIMVYTRQNYDQLEINSGMNFSNNLSEVVHFSEISVIATKASDVEIIVNHLKDNKLRIKNCIISSKGFSNHGKLLSEILYDVTDVVGVIAGPNFAHEIYDGKFTISTLSSNIPDVFSNKYFQIERCNDVIGLQVCSIMKNIYAIGCGIVSAAFESENTKAAFITIAFNELMTAIELFGGEKDTANTAAGLGDLVLTCYSKNSRNHIFGERFIKGNADQIDTIEGYDALMKIRPEIRQALPLCEAIYNFVNNKIDLERFKDYIR